MKHREKVVWSKGMFLTPQHFQAQDAFLEHLVHFRATASSAWSWGVTELSLDPEALRNRTVRVNRCAGVLPDGLAFHIGDSVGAPPSRAVAGHFAPQQAMLNMETNSPGEPPNRSVGQHFAPQMDALDVFLAVPESRPNGPNTIRDSSSTNGSTVRFRAKVEMVADDLNGTEEKPVEFARTEFRLLFGDESLDGHVTIRIAQIVRDPAGNYIYNPKFIAPCLDYAHSPYLLALVRRQIEILTSRSADLTPFRRDKSKSTVAFTTSDVTNFWILHTVHSTLPVLKHYWRARTGHPEELYRVMLQLAGALSTFSSDTNPNDFPEYDHMDLGACFTRLDEQIRLMLQRAVEPGYIAIPFTTTAKKHIRTANLEDPQLLDASAFFLAVTSDMPQHQLTAKVPDLIKLASVHDLGRLVDNALPGLPLRHEPIPPPQMHVKLGSNYFRIEHRDQLWDGIRSSHSIAAYVPAEIVEPTLELLIVRES